MKKAKQHILFGAPGSGSGITEAFLRYANIPYEYRKLDFETRQEWPKIFGQYNSLPQVPTMILPNGEVMTETLATAVHANRKRKGLIPGKKLEDRFWRWAVFIVANIYPTFTIRDNADKFVTGPAAKELADNIFARRKDLWKAVEKECGKKWFLGTSFSAIDIYLMFMTYWTPGREWFATHCPKIFAVSNRVAKIEPFKTLIKEHTE